MENRIEFSDICRICLKSDQFLNNLFETESCNMLKFCGFLEVDEADGLPNKICETCNSSLEESYKLKKLCISSDIYLQSLLASSEELEENVDMECNNKLPSRTDCSEIDLLENVSFMRQCSECGDHNITEQHDCTTKEADVLDSVLDDCDNTCNKNQLQDESSDNGTALITHTYQCPECKILFEHEQDAVIHQSIHGDELICSVCKKTFKAMKMLKRHLKTHMKTKAHTCKICNKSFTESSDVVKHEKRHHMGIPREKNYECKECGQRFTDHYYLRVHERKHTGEKPLKCTLCNRSFYDPRSLRVHSDAHKGIKPYLCSYCGKSFAQSAHLKQHISVHSREKPYSCDICNKKFTQSASLQRHSKLHSTSPKLCQEKRSIYVCGECGIECSTKSNFNAHIKRKHKNFINATPKTIKCPLCNSLFSNITELDHHVSNDHDIPLTQETLQFDSFESFEEWKLNIEKNTRTSYKVLNSRTLKDDTYIIKYVCHRSGEPKLTQTKYIKNGEKQPKSRVRSSKKIGSHCPARITAYVNKGGVRVEYTSTHVGHDLLHSILMGEEFNPST